MKSSGRERIVGVELKVINIGVEIFYHILKEQGVRVIHVDWHPPAGGDKDLIEILEKLS